MKPEKTKPTLVRIPLGTLERLKAFQLEEEKRSPYRVTLTALIVRAINEMLNANGVNAGDNIVEAVEEEIARSERVLSNYPPPTVQAAWFHTDLLKRYLRRLERGSQLWERVKGMIERWERFSQEKREVKNRE